MERENNGSLKPYVLVDVLSYQECARSEKCGHWVHDIREKKCFLYTTKWDEANADYYPTGDTECGILNGEIQDVLNVASDCSDLHNCEDSGSSGKFVWWTKDLGAGDFVITTTVLFRKLEAMEICIMLQSTAGDDFCIGLDGTDKQFFYEQGGTATMKGRSLIVLNRSIRIAIKRVSGVLDVYFDSVLTELKNIPYTETVTKFGFRPHQNDIAIKSLCIQVPRSMPPVTSDHFKTKGPPCGEAWGLGANSAASIVGKELHSSSLLSTMLGSDSFSEEYSLTRFSLFHYSKSP